MRILLLSTALMAIALPTAANAQNSSQTSRQSKSSSGMMQEANALQQAASREAGRSFYTEGKGVKFKAQDNVFLKSALAIDFTYRNATVTLPLYRGRTPDGQDAFYIITEASDASVARSMGLNFSPKMAKAAGTAGAMAVTLESGVLQFPGSVDFSPEYAVVPGDAPTYFPPKSFAPGAKADANYSSMAVLPSGVVLNVQIVANRSGMHDRAKSMDAKSRKITMSLLDGFHNGKQYFYHLVTDVSADLPAVLEKGVFAPRLANIPTFGKSEPGDDSALLGFSPVLNGSTDMSSGEDQGFSTSLRNGGIDPINIFPVGPHNSDTSQRNNYSPLWDAHVNMWTPKAVAEGKVKRIRSLGELQRLIRSGDVTDAIINPPGQGNAYVGGLRPTRVVINCPVIAQPNLKPR